MINYNSILNKEPNELLDWLVQTFFVEVPQEIISVSDMELASKLLIKLSSNYSYLCALSSYAKIKTREYKRYHPKEEYEDMVDKKEIIQNITDCVKQQYAAISRAVTIHVENNAELRMNATGAIRG